MKAITPNKDGLKIHVGSDAVIQADAEGKVLSQRPAGTRPMMIISGRRDATLKVGTEAEIAAEAEACAVRYAPIKDQIEAAAKLAEMATIK